MDARGWDRRCTHAPAGPDAGVCLAAEAALLEAHAGLLREAIDAVDARIEAVTRALRLLPAQDGPPHGATAYDVLGQPMRKS